MWDSGVRRTGDLNVQGAIPPAAWFSSIKSQASLRTPHGNMGAVLRLIRSRVIPENIPSHRITTMCIVIRVSEESTQGHTHFTRSKEHLDRPRESHQCKLSRFSITWTVEKELPSSTHAYGFRFQTGVYLGSVMEFMDRHR